MYHGYCYFRVGPQILLKRANIFFFQDCIFYTLKWVNKNTKWYWERPNFGF